MRLLPIIAILLTGCINHLDVMPHENYYGPENRDLPPMPPDLPMPSTSMAIPFSPPAPPAPEQKTVTLAWNSFDGRETGIVGTHDFRTWTEEYIAQRATWVAPTGSYQTNVGGWTQTMYVGGLYYEKTNFQVTLHTTNSFWMAFNRNDTAGTISGAIEISH